MHVAHLMIGDLPFPHDWADAAATAVAVSKISTSLSAHSDVTTRRSMEFRPSRLFWRVNDRLAGASIRSAVDEVARQRGRVDVLHGHFASAARPLVHASRRTSARLVVTEHFSGATDRAAPHKRLGKAGWARARTLYTAADQVVAVSRYLADSILENTGIDSAVIGNPIDVDLFQLGDPVADPPIALFVGRLDQDKRADLLLRGIASHSCPSDLQLVIIGDGPDRTKLERLMNYLGLSARVVLTGRIPRDEVAAWARRATIGVSTSHVETFGVAVAEMASAGLPVIAPDLRPFDEVIPVHGRLLFEDGSAEALGASIAVACNASWDRSAIRQTIVDRFSPFAIGEQLQKLYSEVASE